MIRVKKNRLEISVGVSGEKREELRWCAGEKVKLDRQKMEREPICNCRSVVQMQCCW